MPVVEPERDASTVDAAIRSPHQPLVRSHEPPATFSIGAILDGRYIADVSVRPGSGGIEKPTWPYLGPLQKRLLLAGIAIWIGCALPWAVVVGKALWGAPMAVSWVLWAGLVVVSGAVVRWRAVAILSALGGGGVAVFFAVWQTMHVFTNCGFTIHCVPGPGLGLLLVGGIGAIHDALLLHRARPTPAV